MEEGKKVKSIELKIAEVKTEIKIMLELVEDPEMVLFLKNFYKENKSKGLDFLQLMLDGLTNENYSFIS